SCSQLQLPQRVKHSVASWLSPFEVSCGSEKTQTPSMRERPQAQLVLSCRPQPRQTMRLDNQEPHNEHTEQHELQMRSSGCTQTYTNEIAQLRQSQTDQDRQHNDESRAEKIAHDGTQPTDDDHEQQQQRHVQPES